MKIKRKPKKRKRQLKLLLQSLRRPKDKQLGTTPKRELTGQRLTQPAVSQSNPLSTSSTRLMTTGRPMTSTITAMTTTRRLIGTLEVQQAHCF